MRILIRRTFKHVKEDKLFVKGKDYAINKELGNWIARKGLGTIIPEMQTNGKGNHKLKDIKNPPKNKMINSNDVKTK